MDATVWTYSRPISVLARLASVDVGVLYLVLGLLGVLPLVLLTPPFQVPDEHQHFFRAYQLSELDVRGVVQGGAAGAVLPSSLPELADRFLGSRALHVLTGRAVGPSPLRDTLGVLATPLNPARREFVDFTGAVTYWPLPYLPQVAAIVMGRELGLGPLGLLYAARLANGLAALLMVTAALRVLLIGNMVLLVLGLMPMVLFEFASTAPDAATISAALLFTAIAMRARFRGRWGWTDVLLACIAGAVFCPLKPVYAPLLVMGLPGVFRRGAAGHVIAVHAALVGVVLGATALWLAYNTSALVLPREGTSVSQQLAGIMSHPGAFAGTVLNSVQRSGIGWLHSMIGVLGWSNVSLPRFMYVPPIAAVLACVLLRRPATPRVGPAEAVWQALLIGASALLVLVALYLYWTPVGSGRIEGVQGRYFLPLAGLASVTLCAAVPPPLRVLGPMVLPVVLLMVTAEIVLTSIVIVQRYQVF